MRAVDWWALAAWMMVLAGCGGGGDDPDQPAPGTDTAPPRICTAEPRPPACL